MPRAKKNTRIKDRDREVSNFWSKLIRRALKAKQDYTHTADTVEAYLSSRQGDLEDNPLVDLEGSHAVTVPKIAQMRNTLGPRLYQTKPVRTVTPTTDDGVMLGLGRTLEKYLNYTVREANFKKHLRKAIDDGLIRGRGFLAQDVEPIRGIVTSRFVCSRDVVFDPDFEEIEDAKWVALRMSEPLWETERRITEKWRIKNLGQDKDHATHVEQSEEGNSKKKTKSYSAEMVTYWVVLSKMGVGYRGMDKDKRSRRNDDKDFVRLEIVLDHEVPLAEGEWDVPLYLDKDWPLSAFDPIDPVGSAWPESIAGQVLGSQQAIDLLSTIRLSSCKNRDRVVLLGDSQILDNHAKRSFRHGSMAEFIPLDLPPGKSITDAAMMVNFGAGSQESLVEREFHTQQIETTTGVTDVLHGGQEAQAKERSATASRLRSDAANARVSDLRDRAETFHSDAARKEALLARLLLDAEDVAQIVRNSDIQMFWIKIQVPGGAHVKVRDTRPQEEREENPEGVEVTLEQIDPMASNFFEDPNQAFETALQMYEGMLMSEDPRVISLTQSLGPPPEQQVDPMTGAPIPALPDAIMIDVVTAEIVWEATAGITAEELVREFSYELATGTGHQLNKEAMQANADNLVQTVMPAAMAVFQSTGDPGPLNKILQIKDEAFDVHPTQRVQFDPLMLPQPPGQPLAPDGEGE